MFCQGQLAVHGLAILLGRNEAGISNRGKIFLHHAVHPCSTFWVASAAPRLATLSNNSSFSHASQRVQYILTKEHWLNINIAPEAGNGPRLAGFSGVLSPLSVCRTPLPPVNKNVSSQREVSHFSPLLSKTSMRNRWHLFDAFVRAR